MKYVFHLLQKNWMEVEKTLFTIVFFGQVFRLFFFFFDVECQNVALKNVFFWEMILFYGYWFFGVFSLNVLFHSRFEKNFLLVVIVFSKKNIVSPSFCLFVFLFRCHSSILALYSFERMLKNLSFFFVGRDKVSRMDYHFFFCRLKDLRFFTCSIS